MGRVRRYFYYAPAGPRLRGYILPAGPVENKRDRDNGHHGGNYKKRNESGAESFPHPA